MNHIEAKFNYFARKIKHLFLKSTINQFNF